MCRNLSQWIRIKVCFFCSKTRFSALTGGEFKHSAVWVVVDSGLGRSISRAAADLGCPVQVTVTDHLDVEHLDAVWTGRFPHLVGRLLKLNGGSWRNRRKVSADL